MGLKDIKLGPKSRSLVAAEQARLKAEIREVLSQPQIGCACGQAWITSRETVTIDQAGVVHRYGLPCYHAGTDTEGGRKRELVRPLDLPGRLTELEQRVAELERKLG